MPQPNAQKFSRNRDWNAGVNKNTAFAHQGELQWAVCVRQAGKTRFCVIAKKSKDYQFDKYSSIYAKLVENKCKLFINSHIVSEFINRCLRIDFEKNVQDISRSKDFKADY